MLKIINQSVIDNIEKGPIYRSLFSNGACLLQHEAEGFASAKVSVNFIAGSIFESVDQHGLAHLIEHLIFKETKTDYIKFLEQAGAELNAYTYKENVCFEMSCLSKKIDYLLPYFLEVFLSLDFSDEQLSKEKKVVMQELNEDKDDHETQGLEFVFQKNFDDRVGHPVGGTISQVRRYKRVDVEKFYKKYFTPDRMILTIVNGSDPIINKNIFKHALTTFSTGKERKPFRIKSVSAIKKIKHFNSVKKRRMESAISYFSFNGPSVKSDATYDFIVLDELLFEGLSSLFFKKFREERPLVYGLGSTLNSFSACGNYIMVFNSNSIHINDIKAGVKDVLGQIAQDGPVVADMTAIKNKIMDTWEMAFDDIEERAEFIAENEIYQNHEFGIPQIREKISRVSIESIKKLVENIFIKNDYSTLILKNKGI